MDTYFRFEIWFYKANESGQFTEVTAINIIADSLKKAIKKAKKFDDRKYFVKNITEIVKEQDN